jgi:hypothetical protein
MVATATTKYGNAVGSNVLVGGNTCNVDDATIASVVGSGNSVRCNGDFSIMLGGGVHLNLVRGVTYQLSAAVVAKLVAASAPITAI